MPGEVFLQFTQSDWKRPAGSPHTSLLDTMKKDLSSHNLSVENATELALDRPLRRLLAAMELCTEMVLMIMMIKMMRVVYYCFYTNTDVKIQHWP